MITRTRATKHLNLTQATDSLAAYIQKLGEDKRVIIQEGQPVAGLMPVTEDELEDISLSKNPQFLAILEQSRASLHEKGGASLEQVKRRLGLAQGLKLYTLSIKRYVDHTQV